MATNARLSRPRLDRFGERGFEPYVTAIGRLTLAWNSLHEAMARTFLILLAGANPDPDDDRWAKVQEMWHSVRSDLAQREMLRAVAKNPTTKELESFPRLGEDIDWLISDVNVHSGARNDAIHSPLILVSGKNPLSTLEGRAFRIMPQYMGGNKMARRLLERELLADFRWCRDRTLVYRDFLAYVNRSLASASAPWPRRPSPPDRPPKKTLFQRQRPGRKR